MSIVIPKSLVVSRSSLELRYYPWILWDNKVIFGSVSADFEADLYPASALANSNSTIYWMSTSTADQYITVVNLDGQIDGFGLARHNLAGATLSIEAINADSSPDFAEVVAPWVQGDNSPILARMAKDSYTSMRLKIVSPTAIPWAAVLSIGEILIVPQGFEPGYTPIGDGEEIDLSVGRSTIGEFLGSIVEGAALLTTSTFNRLPRTWYETYMRPFIKYANRGGTFFFAWSPVLRPKDVGYCWFTASVKPVITTTQSHYQVDLPMAGIAL